VLAVTAEEVWQLMRSAGWVREASVHLAAWPQAPAAEADDDARRRWATLLSLREPVMKALEEQRSRGLIGSPLEARVTLLVGDPSLQRLCEEHRETLAEAFVVSGVAVRADGARRAPPTGSAPGGVSVEVERAPEGKCARCWKRVAGVGSVPAHPQLCERCAAVVTSQTTG
jgi:isoleucyl-tRNA synthetase